MKALTGLLAMLLMLSCASLAQTVPAQEAAPTQQPAATDTAAAVPVVPLAPGAKVFLDPMNGFEQFLPDAIVRKKAPIVVVKDRADADFVMSGTVHVKKPGWITGMVLGTSGGVNVALADAHTGKTVFACSLHRADEGLAEAYQYQKWADQCASRLNKAMTKKK